MKIKINKNDKKAIIGWVVIFFLIVILLWPFSKYLNFKIEHWVRRLISSYSRISKDIIIVAIDDDSIAQLWRFPFDRTRYINVLRNLKKAGAVVIGMDILFPEESNRKSDWKFSEAIKYADNVVLGYATLGNGKFLEPIKILKKNMKGYGYLTPSVDPNLKVATSIKLFKDHDGKVIDPFFLNILRIYYSYIYADESFLNKEISVADAQYYDFIPWKIQIPFMRRNINKMYINFNLESRFQTVSFHDVFDAKKFKSLKEKVDFKDKVVLIGTTAKGIKDIFMTPNGIENGIYIHANAINTVFYRTYFSYINAYIEYLLLIVFTIVTLICGTMIKNKAWVFWSLFGSLIGFLVLYFILMKGGILLNYPIYGFVIVIFVLGFSFYYKYTVEWADRIMLQQALSQYVSKEIAQLIMEKGSLKQEWERKQITIFFSDIAGFTTISEKMTPEELVMFLRKYLTEFSDIIMEEKWFINKYEGDAIMALWGAFSENDRHSFNACMGALKQQGKLLQLNKEWKEGKVGEIQVRMGIHTGEAIVGNIGSEGKKMEFTALGDSVNLASRLEGVNKYYGTCICVSESVFNENQKFFIFRYLDKIRVKGKNEPIQIYELVGLTGMIPEAKRKMMDEFDMAMKYYQTREFELAWKMFRRMAQEEKDGPSETYMKRCEMYMTQPPGDMWDGVWNMDEK